MVRTAVHAYAQYGYEGATYGGGATTRNLLFGLDQRLSGIVAQNNPIPIYALHSPLQQPPAYGQNRYGMSVDFILSNPWIFKSIFPNMYTSGMASPYAHKFSFYTDADPVVNPNPLADVNPIDIEIGLDTPSGSDLVRNFKGAGVTSLGLSGSIGNSIRGKADIISGIHATSTTLDTSIATDDINFPYTFVHGTLKVPTTTTGTTLATVAELQSHDISFDSQMELLYDHGTADAVGIYRKAFNCTGKFTASMVNDTMLKKVLDRSGAVGTLFSTPVFSLIYTNGLAGASERSITIQGYGIYSGEHSVNIEPVEPIFEDLSWTIRDVRVTAINASPSVP